MTAMLSRRRAALGTALLLVLIVIYGAVSWAVVNKALVAEAVAFEEHPADLGLTFEEVSFGPRGWEEITLRGWWFPSPAARGTIVWVHGLDGNRADRLELIRDLLAEGFAVLAFDLRGHGESDKSQMGAGIHEQDDVLGAVDYVVRQRGVAEGQVLLMGESFGGAVVLMAGVREPAVGGVYADSAFAALTDVMVSEVADRTPIPGWGASLLRPGLIRAARWLKGLDIDDVRPEQVVSGYPYVIGLAHCRSDDRIPFEHAVRLRREAPAGGWFTVYPDCAHAEAYDDFPEQYVAVVTDYFRERLGE